MELSGRPHNVPFVCIRDIIGGAFNSAANALPPAINSLDLSALIQSHFLTFCCRVSGPGYITRLQRGSTVGGLFRAALTLTGYCTRLCFC